MSERTAYQVQEVFDRAVALPPECREAFLDSACASDDALRSEVEGLLASDAAFPDEGDDGVLTSPLVRTAGTEIDSLDASALRSRPRADPERVGRYRLVRVLGEGGMGRVYEAEQDDPRRIVALKVVRAGLASELLLKRFAHEAQILGRLRHPGIAEIYEAGIAEDGRPFFAMELLQGLPLDEYARFLGPSVPDRLDLLARVCDAVQHAHDRGVIHRDLKPANILVDQAGRPKVLDFGVARVTDADLRTTSARTQAGQLLGTLGYMSPEQVVGDPEALDGRSDVYTLGVILYELMAGERPYCLDHLSLPEAARVICEHEPSRLGSLNTSFRGDVETIAAKALAKDPSRRYASAADLAADLRRHLDGRPIRARRVGSVARAARWCRRRPGTAALLATLALVIVTCFPLVTWKWREAEQTARREIRARRQAEERRQEARRSLYVANVRLAQQAYGAGQPDYMRDLLDEAARRQPGDVDLRGFEWYYLRRLGPPKPRTFPSGSSEGVAFGPDGRVAVAGSGGMVRIWDPASGRVIVTLRGHERGVQCVTFSPDGRTVATGGTDRTVRVWRSDTGREILTIRSHTDEVRGVAFSPDGLRLASASSDHSVRIWDASTWRELQVIRPYEGSVMGVAFSPDGRRLALAYGDPKVIVCDADSGRELLALTPQSDWMTGVAFSPDGRSIAAGSEDRAVHVWEANTGKELRVLRGHADWVTSVAFGRDGRLVSSSRDGTARVWDVSSGRELLILPGHSEWAMGAAFSPDGREVATVGHDGFTRLWAAESQHPEILEHPAPVRGLAFSPDGRLLASAGQDGIVRIWEADGDKEPLALAGHEGIVTAVNFAPDGRLLASSGRDGTVRIWDAASGREARALKGHTDWVLGVAFSPDGRLLASTGRDGAVRLWDVDSGREIRRLQGRSDENLGAAFSPDGRWIASAVWPRVVPDSANFGIRIWEVQTGREIRTIWRQAGENVGAAFSPDGRWIASAGRDRTVRVWEARTGREVFALKGHAGEVLAVTFSPDGRRLASAGADRTVRLWDTASGRELLVLSGHTGRLTGVSFSPDGRRLASSSEDRTVRIWDARADE